MSLVPVFRISSSGFGAVVAFIVAVVKVVGFMVTAVVVLVLSGIRSSYAGGSRLYGSGVYSDCSCGSVSNSEVAMQ